MDGSDMTRPRPVGAARARHAGQRRRRRQAQPRDRHAALPDVDPFLMLDEFRSDDAADYIAGFPDHPHRGFETVTYMLAGRMRHGDNKGHTGRLDAGSVQWMTAGRGIVHSEMPEQENGLMQGFQLWVNLPAKDKMIAPRYQEIPPAARSRRARSPGGVTVEGHRRRGRRHARPDRRHRHRADPARPRPAGRRAASTLPLPRGPQRLSLCLRGRGRGRRAGDAAAARQHRACSATATACAIGAGDGAARVLLVAGKPLNEPVARYGPFVMNTPQRDPPGGRWISRPGGSSPAG